MSLRFVCTVLLILASFAALVQLGRCEWNLHEEQRQALSRVKPPEFFEDFTGRPG